MKVIIKLKRSPKQYFLVSLAKKSLIDEVKELINKKKNDKAIVTALSKGKFERELTDNELLFTDADLILTEHNAMWNLTR